VSRRFVLAGDRLLLPEGERPGALLVEEGEIVGLVERSEVPADWPLEEAGDAVVMAGLVDAHLHINDPGRAHWEGFETATRAAAAGGITTLVDMPLNSSPVTTDPRAFEAKLAAARGRLHVDCAFWAGLVPGNLHHLGPLLDAGARGVKAFLVHSGLDEFPASGAAELGPAMELLARRGRPLLAHAERPGPGDAPWSPALPEARSYAGWLASRPPRFETRAIELLLDLCRQTGCPLHIVHVATEEALPLLDAARAEGLPVSAETCPHYLTFAAEEIPDGAPLFKCAPPIRGAATRGALRRALVGGALDLVASDHSPAPPERKHLDDGDLARAWGGIASLQLLLPATWTALADAGLPLHRLPHLLSRAPARLAGLDGRKGSLAPGHDADLVVWRPEASFTVHGEHLHHRHPITPYGGLTLRGVVERTFLRGEEVFRRGEFPLPAGGRPLL
jgi:allantoinase